MIYRTVCPCCVRAVGQNPRKDGTDLSNSDRAAKRLTIMHRNIIQNCLQHIMLVQQLSPIQGKPFTSGNTCVYYIHNYCKRFVILFFVNTLM
jgi:hypothetical protein